MSNPLKDLIEKEHHVMQHIRNDLSELLDMAEAIFLGFDIEYDVAGNTFRATVTEVELELDGQVNLIVQGEDGVTGCVILSNNPRIVKE